MELVSRRPKLPYGGKTYDLGEHFEAEERYARLLILARAADEATVNTEGYRHADLEPQRASGTQIDAGEYARRDIQPAPIKRKRGRPRKVRPNGDA